MNSHHLQTSDIPEASREPIKGLHAGHYFYRWDRWKMAQLQRERGGDWDTLCKTFVNAVDLNEQSRTQRYQSYIISGQKADFAIIMMDSDPLKIDCIHQQIMASQLGAALDQTYSFVSMSEVSEYLPNREQYAEKLRRSGEDPQSPGFLAKVNGYEKRFPMMLAQRLAPDFPDWPAMCFYPMSKARDPHANWFTQPFSKRSEMMSEHAQSGMVYAGRVTQLVTGSVGLDDWEWGVTLWAKNPQYLKEIVYNMRFDQASARYGLFGPFYTGYRASGAEILGHCHLNSPDLNS
jgi:chlorite dismutase